MMENEISMGNNALNVEKGFWLKYVG